MCVLNDVGRSRAAPVLWGRALLVVVVIGAAHLGLFLLLTASARNDLSALDERYGRAALDAVDEPGPRPREGAEGPAWLRKQAVWEAARTRTKRQQYVSLLGYGLLGSFLVQAAVTGILLYRSTHGRARTRGRSATSRTG